MPAKNAFGEVKIITGSGSRDKKRMPVIDVHTHLGDILYPGGETLIHAGPVKTRFCIDLNTVSGWMGHRMAWYRDRVIARYSKAAIVLAERKRNSTASLKSAVIFSKLVSVFGPERALFASGWPFGNPGPMIRVVKSVCRNDHEIERLIFYDNAVQLLGL